MFRICTKGKQAALCLKEMVDREKTRCNFIDFGEISGGVENFTLATRLRVQE